MIFTMEPWYNEPGREKHTNKRDSEKYNAQIQTFTIQHAILHWLEGRLARPAGSSTQTQASHQPQATNTALPSDHMLNLNSIGAGNPYNAWASSGTPQMTQMSWQFPQFPQMPEVPPMPPTPQMAQMPHQSQPSQVLQTQGMSQMSTMSHMPPIPQMPYIQGVPPPVHFAQAEWLQPGLGKDPQLPGYVQYTPYQPKSEPLAVPAPTVDDPVWGEVIRKHFSANAKDILGTAKTWQPSSNTGEKGAKSLVVDLQEMLTLHGFLPGSL